MVDVTRRCVRAFVEELDAMEVAPGSRAHIEADGLPGVRVAGQVVHCSPYMLPKSQFANRPDERIDVKVREVVIQLAKGDETDRLVVGLPVDVYVERCSRNSR